MAMVIHAAANSSFGVTDSTFAVALGAADELSLLVLEAELRAYGILHHAFREPNCNHELMSVGICPIERRVVRRFLRRFSLIGQRKET